MAAAVHRVDPEAPDLRARNASVTSASGRDKKHAAKAVAADDEDDVKETVCTMIVKELDPRSIIQWPGLFVRSLIRVLQVLASIRFIRMGDVIAGLVNTALLFTFAAVFSSGTYFSLARKTN